jgi:hypothetical protein
MEKFKKKKENHAKFGFNGSAPLISAVAIF